MRSEGLGIVYFGKFGKNDILDSPVDVLQLFVGKINTFQRNEKLLFSGHNSWC